MRTLTLAAVAAAAFLSLRAAVAADFPNSYGGNAYAPQVEETWSGFYVGGLVGYGFGNADSSIGDFEPDGFLGGITAGMNYQWDQFLLGAETDIMMAGINEEGAVDYDLDWVGTVRGRIGYAFDRFVVFGTGGFAWTNAEIDGAGEDSNMHGGWTIGGGVEAAVTGNVSVKADYLYMDFTEESYAPGGTIEPDLHTFRLGVNYKF
jgi:outer membrane immunogenic protein